MKVKIRKILLFSLLVGACFFIYRLQYSSTNNLSSFSSKDHKKEENIQKQNQLYEMRKNMPRFTFFEFSLADSPQEIIENALDNYSISTTFEVNQNHKSIKSYDEDKSLSVIDMLPEGYTDDIRNFFDKHRLLETSRPLQYSIDLRIPDEAIKKGVQVDIIYLSATSSDSKIFFYYVTLPNKPARLFYMKAEGKLIKTVPEFFHKRYGETNQNDLYTKTWASNKEIAILTTSELFIIEKAAYDEIFEKIAPFLK